MSYVINFQTSFGPSRIQIFIIGSINLGTICFSPTKIIIACLELFNCTAEFAVNERIRSGEY